MLASAVYIGESLLMELIEWYASCQLPTGFSLARGGLSGCVGRANGFWSFGESRMLWA
jgi:hypothetical protein